MAFNPRGEPTFPDWKQASAGTRVRQVRTGATGTVVRNGARHLTVDWDDVGFGVSRGRVVAPAYDLEPIAPGPSPMIPPLDLHIEVDRETKERLDRGPTLSTAEVRRLGEQEQAEDEANED